MFRLAKRVVLGLLQQPRRHPFITKIFFALGSWVALCFLLGYRLPSFDQHPDWPELPQVTNPRFVIEVIPDTTFNKLYGKRFELPQEFHDETKDYSSSIRNVRFLGYRVLSNEFHSGISFSYPGPNSTGHVDPHPTPSMQFSQRGYEYYELRLGQQTAYFKDIYFSPFPPLLFFYQYNYPQSEQDTFFLYSPPDNYRIYLKNSVQTR